MPRTRLPGVIGTVYGLVDPITNQVRYVGQTTSTIEERLYSHLANCELKKDSPKSAWLNSLLEKGLKPTVIVLATGVGHELMELEKHWIETYRVQDCGLTNRYSSKDKRNLWLQTFNPTPSVKKQKLSEETLAQIDREKQVISRMLRNGHRTSLY